MGDKWNLDNLNLLIESSNSKAEILEKMGLTTQAGNYRTLGRYFKKYGLDDNMFVGKEKRYSNKQKYNDSEVFCENSQYSSAHLKNRILKSNLLEYNCVKCGNKGEWNGEKLVLQIDHINGVNNDNRIENLRFLCPNCHSQTSSFSIGTRKPKNKEPKIDKRTINHDRIEIRKVEWPSKEILIELLKTMTYVAIGKKFGVSDNAVRKWSKKYGII